MENPTKTSLVVQTMMVMVGRIIPGMHFPMTPPSGMTLMVMEAISQMMKSLCGDNQTGNNLDLFPTDGSQCKDTDGDGYGDNNVPGGDAFHLMGLNGMIDGDGFGDNTWE